MSTALKICETEVFADRPGWIPHDITHDWDTNPYAYQTEEELMPAGGTHGRILNYIVEILRIPLKSKELMLLMDTFMLYRNSEGVRKRIAPDLLLMPFRSSEPSSYDLDKESPPLAVFEITSPKSHLKDLEENVPFYAGLGITSYLVVDAITPQSRLREQIGLHLWRNKKGLGLRMQPDTEGYFHIPEMNVSVKASGNSLIFKDSLTGDILHDTEQLRQLIEKGQQRAEQEKQRAEQEKQRAEQEKQRAEQEKQRAEQEKQRAEQEKQKTELLAAKLRSLGIDPDELADCKSITPE